MSGRSPTASERVDRTHEALAIINDDMDRRPWTNDQVIQIAQAGATLAAAEALLEIRDELELIGGKL